MEKLSLEKKAELFDKFIKFYAEDVPFGSMPKTNTDAFIYGLLEEYGYFKECKKTQDIAIKLRITPAKVRSLMLSSALYKGFNVKNYTKEILECLGSSASFVDNSYITLCINDSRVKASLQIICANNKILTNENFNEEILIFPIKDYARLLESFVPKGKEKELEDALLEGIKANKWQITKKQIQANPITKVLTFGAQCVMKNTITAILPTSIIVDAINTINKFGK